MQNKSRDIALFQEAAQLDCSLNWYAIADSAQHSALPKAIADRSRNVHCLFGASQGSPLSQHSPHLVELDSPLEDSKAWSWISLHAKLKPCISIIATKKSFTKVFDQLADCIEVVLPEGEAMYFAFWDPAILGTIMGQADDDTLHVKGPVLSAVQRSKLMNEARRWWYWDRLGTIHTLVPGKETVETHNGPLILSQEQVDALIEASVPDHILYFINLNQKHLFANIPLEKRYGLVSHALARAREIGLTGMRDMVNYVCVELIYKERMNEGTIKRIFFDVKNGRIQFDAALGQLP